MRDLDGRLLREYEAHTSWGTFRDYIYRGTQLLASAHSAEGVRHFHLDHLGTPRLVTAGGTGGDFYTLTPCRVLDTRNQSAPLAAGETRTVPMVGSCGIPGNAAAVAVNITVVNASTNGEMTAYPANESRPTASAISYKVGLALANNGILKLGHGALAFFNNQSSGSAHLIIDVNGYFTADAGAVVAYHAYYPFGEEAMAFNQDTEQMKFTGHERDLGSLAGAGDDLDYMHARHCSPLTGRFLSIDRKLNARAAMKWPQRWNRYAYGVGNPMTMIDPDGREAIVFIAGPSGANDPKGVFGHAALYVTSRKGTAGLSYGGARGFEKGISDFIAFYTGEGRQVKMYVLKTTPEQDQKMVEFLKKYPNGKVDRNAPGGMLMVAQNCTTAVCNTLQTGGVLKEGETASGAMTFFSAPSELQESLETGELSDDVKAVVIFDPEADEKAQQTSSDLQSASCFYTGVCGVPH